jgi:hypothetical protein
MANYFNYYPKVVYNLNNNQALDTVVNLTTNFSFIGDLIDNSSVYYEYTIADGDTPEIVSHKIYSEPFYHWIILRFNNIIDVKTQWPCDYNTLIQNIENYYSQFAGPGQTGLEWAMSNYHSQYRIETKTYQGLIEQTVEKYEIDAATWASLSPSTTQYVLPGNVVMTLDVSKDRKTFYEYELELNEKKRNIKILKNEFITPVKEEFVRIMTNE